MSSEADKQKEEQDQSGGGSNSEDTNTSNGRGFEQLKSYVLSDKLGTALWATRFLTLIFCISYLFPFFR